MTDNFTQISELLKFDNENQFYFLQILQRKKDHKGTNTKLGPNNSSRLIKAYYIYSAEKLLELKPEIIALCNLFNARAGISLNRRDAYKISLELIALAANQLRSGHYGTMSKLYNTVCGQHHSDSDKTWILDVDGVDLISPGRDDIRDIDEYIATQNPVGLKVIAIIPTKSGYHMITKPFDPREFSVKYPEIEIHKNNPTTLYVP